MHITVLLFCLVSQSIQTLCSQVYAEPYYDPTIKLVLRNEKVLAEFISVFVDIPHVTVIEFLDNHMNPLQSSRQARKFMNDGRFQSLMRRVKNLRCDQISVQLPTRKRERPRNPAVPCEQAAAPIASSTETDEMQDWEEVQAGADFLHKCNHVFTDLKRYFPVPERNSQLDVICRISGGSIAMIEVQVIPEDYWDTRALYYASGVFFNQLRSGGTYEELRKVISIQLLGTGDAKSSPWKSTPDEYIRHYKFVDKDRNREMDQIELFQICVPHLKNVRQDMDPRKKILWREWTDFLKSAHQQNAEYVETLTSSNLKAAYASLKLDAMPKDVLERYYDERRKLTRYSQFTSLKIEEVRTEMEAKFDANIKESAVRLLPHLGNEDIATTMRLDLSIIKELREETLIKGSDHAQTILSLLGCGE